MSTPQLVKWTLVQLTKCGLGQSNKKLTLGNHGGYIDNIATGIMRDNIVEKADESVQNEHWSPQAWYHSHYNWVVP